MNILVLNSGGSSLKYKLINMETEKILAQGMCEKIGEPQSIIRQSTYLDTEYKEVIDRKIDHKEAFRYIENALTDEKHGIIKSLDEVSAVGHRVVHGGEYFKGPAIIDDDVIDKIKSLSSLAPLHNPAHLSGILACKELLSENIPQVAVFDTSFYSEIPEKAFMFPVPYGYYKKYHVRKYGFHGTSHKYVSERFYSMVGSKDKKIISCHLGNGSSITAIDKGVAVETSMGLTPLGGIMMGSRSGSIDPSVILHIAEKEKMGVKEMNDMLNKQSGLLGISQISKDDREIMKAENEGNELAKLAHKMMVYQISQYIGAYNVVLQGFDTLIFTGGIGENQYTHRKNICKNLEFMGVLLDDGLNKKAVSGKEMKISSENSKIAVWVIPTIEEMEIANETMSLLINIPRENG